MLLRWAELVTRAPRRALAALVVIVAAAAVLGIGVVDRLGDESELYDTGSESWAALVANYDHAGPRIVPDLLIAVDDPSTARLERVRRVLRDRAVIAAIDPRELRTRTAIDNLEGRSALRSTRGDLAAVAVYTRDRGGAVDRLVRELRALPGVRVGGAYLANQERDASIGPDLARAEKLAFPLLFVLSLLVFRSLIGALLPVLAGAITVLLTLFGMRVATEVTDLSQYTLNVVTGLGLGLSIDYSLLVLWRHREEVAAHGYGREALRRTLATAGRTVAVSAVTVAAALVSLTVFPIGYLRSIGIGGALTAIAAGLVALSALPILLTLLGARVEALTPRRWRAAIGHSADRTTRGPWYRIARAAMRRPVLTALAATAIIAGLALPLTQIELGSITSADVPKGSEVGQVARELQRELPVRVEEPITVLARGQTATQLRALTTRIGRVDGVATVARPLPLKGGWRRVDVLVEQRRSDADVTRALRGIDTPGRMLVGGSGAAFADQRTAIGAHIPAAVVVMTVALLVLLFLLTGSVVLPVKALVMTAMSVVAALGIVVLIFQYGHLETLLQYDRIGSFDLTVPVLVATLGVGLSTDYGVFLLTRIRECRAEAGGDEREAIALGLDRTGRVVSAAALLFCVAFGAFALVRFPIVKEIGVGAALSVIIDATIVRALLVPSLMALLGWRNWWAPGPLRRLHDRFGIDHA